MSDGNQALAAHAIQDKLRFFTLKCLFIEVRMMDLQDPFFFFFSAWPSG